jgi:hypothetical protein
MTESVAILKRELDKYRSAQLGSRSNTASPLVGTMKAPIQLPSLNNHLNRLNEPTSIMFTRMDADRNGKRLKRAINRGLLTDQAYEVSCLLNFLKE